jgi:hypothetical protein
MLGLVTKITPQPQIHPMDIALTSHLLPQYQSSTIRSASPKQPNLYPFFSAFI